MAPFESPKFWLRHGRGVPSYDLPAKAGSPEGLRFIRAPKVATQEAYAELQDRGFFSGPRLLELGKSFYTIKSRHGASLKGVVLRDDATGGSTTSTLHSVVTLEALPRCRALLHKVLDLLGQGGGGVPPILPRLAMASPRELLGSPEALGLDRAKLKDSLANGMAHGYKPGVSLPRHVAPGLDGECDGLVVSLEGPSRYEFAHEVPPVTGERISLTWRWFDEDFLQRLHDREAKLLASEDSMAQKEQLGEVM
eukprot:Skav203908  [mRNA]  locus=scaffold228:29968:33998:+ [translate_table: standard]